jgi:hypothetical protein
MHLVRARVQNYRSVRDTGFFEVAPGKTIMVGPNEAGKSAVLQALQQINPPDGVKKFDVLRDYPRALYNDITTKKVDPTNVRVATAIFALNDDDQSLIEEEFRKKDYIFTRYIDDTWTHSFEGVTIPTFASVRKDLARLVAHIDERAPATPEGSAPKETAEAAVARITAEWRDSTVMREKTVEVLRGWLETARPFTFNGQLSCPLLVCAHGDQGASACPVTAPPDWSWRGKSVICWWPMP